MEPGACRPSREPSPVLMYTRAASHPGAAFQQQAHSVRMATARRAHKRVAQVGFADPHARSVAVAIGIAVTIGAVAVPVVVAVATDVAAAVGGVARRPWVAADASGAVAAAAPAVQCGRAQRQQQAPRDAVAPGGARRPARASPRHQQQRHVHVAAQQRITPRAAHRQRGYARAAGSARMHGRRRARLGATCRHALL